MSQLKERLNLSAEQAAKIGPIIEKSLQERNEILANSSQDRKTTRSASQ